MTYQIWFYFGTMQLLVATYKDFKNKRLVDERHNYLMVGASLMLIGFFQRDFWYIILNVALMMILGSLTKKIKGIGEADIQALMWIYLGYGLINPLYLIWFLIIFTVLSLIYVFTKKIIVRMYVKDKKPVPTPFFIVILISFVFNALLFGLYT